MKYTFVAFPCYQIYEKIGLHHTLKTNVSRNRNGKNKSLFVLQGFTSFVTRHLFTKWGTELEANH